MDIVGYINGELTNLTNEQKTAMLADFCEARGYNEEYVKDEDGNDTEKLVQTKKQFMNNDLENYIKIMVNGRREKRAKEAISYEELSI